MVAVPAELRRTGFAATERRDAWWAAPLVQGLLLAVLIAYANWAAFQNANYRWGGYLSPLYSPLITIDWLPLPPSLLILLPPVLFRATCYYYRKAYYRSYFLDPPACAVGELRGARFRFDYEITRDGDVIADGWTSHACVDAKTLRPTRIPAGLAGAIRAAEGAKGPARAS